MNELDALVAQATAEFQQAATPADLENAKARYLGLKRNQARFMLAAMAYNIKRGVAVHAGMMAMAGCLINNTLSTPTSP